MCCNYQFGKICGLLLKLKIGFVIHLLSVKRDSVHCICVHSNVFLHLYVFLALVLFFIWMDLFLWWQSPMLLQFKIDQQLGVPNEAFSAFVSNPSLQKWYLRYSFDDCSSIWVFCCSLWEASIPGFVCLPAVSP